MHLASWIRGLLVCLSPVLLRAADDAALAAAYPLGWLRTHLQGQVEFRPAPPAHDRGRWNAVDPDLRRRLIEAAGQALQEPWETLPVTGYLDFLRDGNRSRYEEVYFRRRQRARLFTLAECLEAKGRFMDAAVNGLWLICEETTWAIPAHLHFQHAGRGFPDFTEPVIDLFAAETGAQLAWTAYLLRAELDRVSPLIRPRVAAEIERRILQPFLQRDDFRWMGGTPAQLNNWTPWIVSNVFASAFFFEPEAERRARVAHRGLEILDRYLAQQTADGGCDEGPGYWSHAAASTFDCLELLRIATGGKLDGFSRPLIRELGKYIYRMHIADDWFVNFADAQARLPLEGALVYRYGERIGDAGMRDFGAWCVQRFDRSGTLNVESLGRLVPGLLRGREIFSTPAKPPLPRDVWFPDLQVMVARGARDTTDGLFVAALGGHNAENHNHNDVGSCVVFADGKPILIDVGVETYSARTFGPNRYSIWTMQSAWHNLPTINGAMQSSGRDAAARDVSYRADDTHAIFSLDLAGTYPPQAHVKRWQRTYTLARPNRLTIEDDYTLDAASNSLEWHFMLAFEPRSAAPGKVVVTPAEGASVQMSFDPALAVKIEPRETADPRLRRVWGERVYRLTLSRGAASASGHLAVELLVGRK